MLQREHHHFAIPNEQWLHLGARAWRPQGRWLERADGCQPQESKNSWSPGRGAVLGVSGGWYECPAEVWALVVR